MGIQGLLPQLKSIMAPIGVADLRGQTVAVDTYSWLHKGALSCGDRLCKGIPTTRHIDYCMHRVNLLRHHGVKPILVFDGGFLPMKSEQEVKRARSRKENLERAREHEAAGNSRAAYECYQKAVDITPKIASELIQVLKREKVDYIVAPYEADAQMAFLSVNKLVDAVITEDSDLLPFGCSRIIFKMDKFGQGVEFQITRLERNRELDLNGFTKQMLLEMCILSGCDYLPSLPGMGVKRAHALIQKLKSHEKVIKHLRYSAVSVPPQYEENFKKAIWAFQFQRVYDPATEDIAHLSGIPHDLNEDDFLGPWLPQAVVKGIALGDIDPFTKEPFEASTQCKAPAFDKGYPIRASAVDKVYPIRESIPSSNGKKRLDLPVQKNMLTNYFCLASLEAKRKFRAPKVTPKQHTLNESSLPSPQTEDSATPDSVEDGSLPTNDTEASQCSFERFSSEPPPDDSINASQCSAEHFSCAFPRDDSASVSPYCNSRDIGSDPPSEDQYLEDTEVEVSYCNASTIPTSPCLERMSPGLADPLLDSYNSEPSRVVAYAESTVAPTNRNITVRSSYFKKDERVYTNQGEDQFDDDDNQETGTSTLSGDQMRNPECITKRRKLWDPQNSEDETLQRTTSHDSPPVDECCDYDSLDGFNTNSEGRFGCNVSHVNKYSGIAEKSMDKFAALISSFRYGGSRASGLRAPLKDVKNTLSVRSMLRPPEQKKNARGHRSQSRSTSYSPNSTESPPDLSTFAYKPSKTAAFLPRHESTKHGRAQSPVSGGGGGGARSAPGMVRTGSMRRSSLPASPAAPVPEFTASPDDYTLMEEIGFGANAVVYRALFLPTNTTIAVKCLDLDRVNSNLDDVRKEAQIMSLIDHPNVIKAYCSFVVDHNLWVIMPFMAEGSCLHLMKVGYPDGLEEPVICSILKETLKALDYLHRQGHIHRDVKAGNILVDSPGVVKLGDFGVSACLFDRGDRQRSRNTFVGTPCWMAPEVLQPGTGYNFKADIWSFGITALELAHGHAPFSKYPPMKVLLMTLQNAPPGLDYDRDRKFSKSFKEMVAMCLVKDQTKRPTAEKLLKHSFFKNTKAPQLTVKSIITDLPPLWERVKTLQQKDAAHLASSEQEALSMSEYQRGVSAWYFDIEDLKAQALLIHDDDPPEIKENDDNVRTTEVDKDASSESHFGKSTLQNGNNRWPNHERTCATAVNPGGNDPETSEELASDLGNADSGRKVDGSDYDSLSSTPKHGSEAGNCKSEVRQKQIRTFSGSILYSPTADSSVNGRGPIIDTNAGGQSVSYKQKNDAGRIDDLSGPLSLSTRASANSLSAPIRSSGGYVGSLGDKPRVEIKGRFSVTSENVDLPKVQEIPVVKVSPRPQEGSALRKSASVGAWPVKAKSVSNNHQRKELCDSSVSASVLIPHLQNLVQQTTFQQDLITNLMSNLQQNENADGLQSRFQTVEGDTRVETSSAEGERTLLNKIFELQSRMISLTDELIASKLKHVQLQDELNALYFQEEIVDRREEDNEEA